MLVEDLLHAVVTLALDGRVLAFSALRAGRGTAPQQVEVTAVTRAVHTLGGQLNGAIATLGGVTSHRDHC